MQFSVIALILSLVAATCGGADSTGDGPVGEPAEPHPQSIEGLVAAATADLAERLDIEAADVELVSAEEVTWPDASLGCPQPGMSYTQAVVNGTRIVLRAGGAEFSYHSGGGRPPFLCEETGKPAPPDRLPDLGD